jgi:leader peptidase (prepilin peptidase)/N-methyltransferase
LASFSFWCNILLMVYVLIALLGLCLGSFVNALVWRTHQLSLAKKKQKISKEKLSILKGRSVCTECGHELGVSDLIPIISWVSLNGNCRYCKKKISWQYPLVESISAVFFVTAYYLWPNFVDNGTVIEYAIFGSFLIGITIGLALSVYDFRWKLLPNKLVKPFALAGAFYAFASILTSNNVSDRIISVLAAITVAGGIFWVLYQVSDGKWIGGGDVKLGFALGLFMTGPIMAFMMIFLASLLGSFYALILKIVGKFNRKSHIPFGPFLLFATYIVVIYGQRIVDIYKDFLYL